MRRSKQELNGWIDQILSDAASSSTEDAVAHLVSRLLAERSTSAASERLVVMAAAEAAGSVEDAPARKSRYPLARKWRRRAMISTFLSTLAGKLAIASVAVAASAGGLAATGSLPDPLQDWAHNTLDQVGIEIPASTDVTLPGEAGDTAEGVLGVIEGGDSDPQDGQDFGKAVADEATGDNADIDELTEGAGDQAGDGAGNASVADDYTGDAGSQADDGADNASVADDYTGDAGSQADDGADNAVSPPLP